MALYAFDGASPSFDLAAAKAAGGIVIPVYIVGTPGGMAHADAARVAAIRAAGMGALPNWERAADFFAICTNAQAQAAGAEAAAACRALEFPDDGSIGCAFSFDFNAPVSTFPALAVKMNAVKVGLTIGFRPMVYAQQALIDYLCNNRILTGKQWLMASTFGQPYQPSSPNVCMVQSHDVAGNWLNSPVPGTDINTVTDPYSVPAWWPDNSPYGGDMPLTDADVAKIWGYQMHATAADGTATSGNHPASVWLTGLNGALGALSGQVTSLAAQVAAIATAQGVDPVALAQAITQHIQLTAK